MSKTANMFQCVRIMTFFSENINVQNACLSDYQFRKYSQNLQSYFSDLVLTSRLN